MEVFAEFIAAIQKEEHRNRTNEVLSWVSKKFPQLNPKIAWNQPMFTDHDTFIIGFSVAKQHLAIAPEKVAIDRFAEKIKEAGYDHTKEIIRIKWNHQVDYSLLEEIIEFNIIDKADCTSFWRK
ncbi:iron chaperone [Alkalihalobacterium bogoriense]|uniref:iron chaperone n=1 Tax=Alkalihalobacterium bogoriense TaxID=246272 RepID=UPI00047A314D|nr:iron chaperone [Alkalihalobacterium bogoriense]